MRTNIHYRLKFSFKSFLLLAACLAVTVTGFSQPKNLIKLDVHSPIGRTGIIAYERVLNPNASVGLSVLYTDRTDMFGFGSYLSRLAVTPEFRYYLQETKAAPTGFYLLGSLRYQHLIEEDYYYNWEWMTPYPNWVQKEKDTFGAGVAVGFQALFKQRICLDIFLGTIFNSGEERPGGPSYPYDSDEFEPYVGYFINSGVRLGVAF